MSTKKIVTVFGATGKQGTGAVEFLTKDGEFHVRAVTRTPGSAAAKALAAKGAEIVQADLNDKASLVKALKGSYGVFGVTDFWTADGKEEIQGKDLVDAAKEVGVKHFVFSTLDHSSLNVVHFETKANVNDHLIASGIPRTSLYTAWFWENVGSPFFGVTRDANGGLVLDVPYATDTPFIAISGYECGVLAGIALKNPKEFIGKDIRASTEITTPRKIAKDISYFLGEKVTVKERSLQEFDATKGQVWEELWLNLKWFYDNPHSRDVEATLTTLGPNLKTLTDILSEKGKAALLPK